MSDMIKGSCRYCGRMEMVEAMDQEDATKNRPEVAGRIMQEVER